MLLCGQIYDVRYRLTQRKPLHQETQKHNQPMMERVIKLPNKNGVIVEVSLRRYQMLLHLHPLRYYQLLIHPLMWPK